MSVTTRAPRRAWPALAGLAAAAALAGCTPHFVPASERGDQPRVQYAGSGLSANRICPVSRSPLNPAIDPVHVNGRPIGFC